MSGKFAWVETAQASRKAQLQQALADLLQCVSAIAASDKEGTDTAEHIILDVSSARAETGRELGAILEHAGQICPWGLFHTVVLGANVNDVVRCATCVHCHAA
jgi:F0F1-type ATP synthase assembly protein I